MAPILYICHISTGLVIKLLALFLTSKVAIQQLLPSYLNGIEAPVNPATYFVHKSGLIYIGIGFP